MTQHDISIGIDDNKDLTTNVSSLNVNGGDVIMWDFSGITGINGSLYFLPNRQNSPFEPDFLPVIGIPNQFNTLPTLIKPTLAQGTYPVKVIITNKDGNCAVSDVDVIIIR